MQVRFGHTNLVARDWRRLAQFYMSTFGCRPKPPERDLKGEWLERLTGIADAQIKGIHLLLPGSSEDGPTLEIFEYNQNVESQSKPVNREGFGHIAFAADNVEECLARVIANGGSTVGDVVQGSVAGAGVIEVVYARDPEGNIVEIQKWSSM